MELPVEGVTLEDLRALTNALLRCGATINEMNALRKHLSQVKGGGLARLAQPARVLSLILSDVLGSPLDVIASGPTAPDSTTFAGALAVVEKYRLREQVPFAIITHLERGGRGDIVDTPKANDPLFARVTNVIVADNSTACEAATNAARARGYRTQLLSTQVQGEARLVGADLAQKAKETRLRGGALPACLIGGGETTVTLRGEGKGGRSQELALAAARELAGLKNVVLLGAGTDGTDGPTDAAGALADGTTIARARALGLDADAFLANNDSYNFFSRLGDLVITGPTNTNVNDLMVVLMG
jgi:glycerate 2-kinase